MRNFFTCTDGASGLFSKKEYTVRAAQTFMMKLCIERCLECTMSALPLSRLLMYLLRYITLFHRNMTCFSMLTLKSVYEMPMYAKETVMPEIGK